ncbi:MAG: hypothetical protein JSS77_14330 [Acidobacteria bacterium]|nr:hypothetical protein [Acidobacteriota bacterium]
MTEIKLRTWIFPLAMMMLMTGAASAQNSSKVTATRSTKASLPHPTVLRCKAAKTKWDRRLCDIIIPAEAKLDAVTTDAFEIEYRKVDLNADGIDEIIVWESSWAGSSGGGLWVLRKTNRRYRKIFETSMTWTPITLLKSSHDGWTDFAYQVAGGGVKPYFVTVVFRDGKYKTGDTSKTQAAGTEIIPQNWVRSVFGPLPRDKH